MASAAQLTANQANSQLSTGPRTEEGKQASARNATTHGICSREFVILPGEQEHFDQLMAELEQDLAPTGAFERELFRQAAHAAWTLRRIRLAEVDLLVCQYDHTFDPLLIDTNEAKLKRLDTYARRADRAFHRAVQELRAAQTERHYRAAAESSTQPALARPSIRCDSPLVAWRSIHPQLDRPQPAPAATQLSKQLDRLLAKAPIQSLAGLALSDQLRR